MFVKQFKIEKAVMVDIPELEEIMHQAIKILQASFLDKEQIEASFEAMGLDYQLIRDQTYFKVIKNDKIIGCGGWSKRKTLFGSSNTRNRDEAFLDKKTEPAKIRAMYTHPNWIRRGIGRLILEKSEGAALEAGFKSCELMATLAGESLYLKSGYKVLEIIEWESASKVRIPLKRMSKKLVKK